jgi:hypothetical protein
MKTERKHSRRVFLSSLLEKIETQGKQELLGSAAAAVNPLLGFLTLSSGSPSRGL